MERICEKCRFEIENKCKMFFCSTETLNAKNCDYYCEPFIKVGRKIFQLWKKDSFLMLMKPHIRTKALNMIRAELCTEEPTLSPYINVLTWSFEENTLLGNVIISIEIEEPIPYETLRNWVEKGYHPSIDYIQPEAEICLTIPIGGMTNK